MQTETKPEQDTAIKNLLSVQGQFFKALVKLANYPEYSLDLITDSLPVNYIIYICMYKKKQTIDFFFYT